MAFDYNASRNQSSHGSKWLKRSLFALNNVFYTCAKDDTKGYLYSTVNGVEIVIENPVWKAVERINMGGVWKFEEFMDGYSKMATTEVCFLTRKEF